MGFRLNKQGNDKLYIKFLAEEQVYYVFTSSRRRLFVNTKTQNLNCFYLTEWSCNNEDENYAAELRAIGC